MNVASYAKKKFTVVAVIWALLGACGGTTDTAPGTIETIAAATEPVVATEGATTTVAEAESTEMTEDLVYHSGGEPFAANAGVIDVITPADGAGPWPTVVVFHGDPRQAGKSWHRADARLIAEQGRVVFLPAWGKLDASAYQEMDVGASWELAVRELKCAVLFAHSHAEEFGGDPGDITLYGLSAGGNAVLMAGLADAEPLDTCTEAGPAVPVQALVPIDADWVLGGGWDSQLSANPEAFYSITPWRHLDGSQDLTIDVMVTGITGPFTRSVEPDPAASWLSYRHVDIDFVADLDERGFLADGDFSLKESGEYAFQVLVEAGYDASLAVMLGAQHASWGDEGTALVVETVLNAAGG